MNQNDIVLSYLEDAEYPDKKYLFRPHEWYPEYPFKKDISKEKNTVYEMVRNSFYLAGFDRKHYGTKEWNPLGKFIKEGEVILLKPNLVMHENPGMYGTECLYTNPALIAAVIDYVCVALKNSGKIIIADAPMQECDFERLIRESGYLDLVTYYQKKGIHIELTDLRNKKTKLVKHVHKVIENKNNGVMIDLKNKSAFSTLSAGRLKKLRITNYHPFVLSRNHNQYHHKYCISSKVLQADVIINMPKPKTHRKAGVTISQKNLIGVNAGKEYLPHYTVGGVGKGDAYRKRNVFLSISEGCLDMKNICESHNWYILCKAAILFHKLFKGFGRQITSEPYFEGSWYGNDTIWRTIKDMNYIVTYADKKGVLQKSKQRRQLIIADFIVAGEGEGPLMPKPHVMRTVAVGYDNLCFDKVICSLMGIDYKKIPSVRQAEHIKEHVISNNIKWDGKTCEELYSTMQSFLMPDGWKNYKNHISLGKK